MEILNVVAIVVVGLLVGTELSVAAFVHPTLDKLPDAAHQPAASSLARMLGKVMPVWYPLASVLTVGVAVLAWRQSGSIPWWLVASAIVWVLVNLYSLIVLVPINTRIASWEVSAAPADWKTYRSRWDMHHRWRVVLLTLAFTLLIVGVIGR